MPFCKAQCQTSDVTAGLGLNTSWSSAQGQRGSSVTGLRVISRPGVICYSLLMWDGKLWTCLLGASPLDNTSPGPLWKLMACTQEVSYLIRYWSQTETKEFISVHSCGELHLKQKKGCLLEIWRFLQPLCISICVHIVISEDGCRCLLF